ncbi:hypothetical protein ACFL1C_00085 [Pseudomonadota bacterium]
MRRRSVSVFPIFISILALWILSSTASLAGTLTIKNANYDPVGDQVVVIGVLESKSDGQQVSLFDSVTGKELEQISTDKNKFQFHFTPLITTGVPCAVTVSAGGESVSADVKHAPDGCSPPTPATLTGRVVDDPLPNAVVKVTVGGQTFFTVADADGYYSIDIVSLLLDDLVLIEASGSTAENPDTVVDFVALIGAFSKTLSDEPQNVTNVTTAQYSLLIEATGGEPITSVEQLAEAEKSVDATELLQLAAVIKLIVDDPDFVIPLDGNGDSYASLLDFVADGAAVEEFVAEVAATDPNALDDAMAAIVSDSDLLPGFSVADIPERFYVINASHPGYISKGGYALEFNPDKSGTILASDQDGNAVDADFTWEADTGQLVVTYPPESPASYVLLLNPQIESTTATQQQIEDFYNCENLGYIAGIVSVFESTFTLLNDGTLVKSAQEDDSVQIQYFPISLDESKPGCESAGSSIVLADKFEVQSYPIAMRDSSQITSTPFTPALVQGKWGMYTFYNPEALWAPRGMNYDIQTFNADGTMSAEFNPENISGYTWSIVDGKLIIHYSDGMVETITITDTIAENPHEYGMFFEFDDGSTRSSLYTLAVKVDPAFAFNTTDLVNPTDYFWNGMVNAWLPGSWNSDGELLIDGYFGWDFKAGGTGVNADIQRDQDGFLYWVLNPLSWTVSGGAAQLDYLGRDRQWLPLAADTTPDGKRRMYVMEWEDRDGGAWILPRVNIQVEFPYPDPSQYDFTVP